MLLPICFLAGVLNYLDRTNLTFAALELNNDLGFTPVVSTEWEVATPLPFLQGGSQEGPFSWSDLTTSVNDQPQACNQTCILCS